MKKILVYIFLFSIIASGCKREDDPVFDDPDVRLSTALSEYQTVLLSAQNGWKGFIYPAGGKGFNYYIKFNEDGRVSMLSDFNSSTAETMAESSYRLKALQRPTLIFDTYSYIHLPSDPNGSISGGTTGSGLKSDFQFAIISVKGDTIEFEGTANKNKMILVKATAAEESGYLAAGIKISMQTNASYLTANKFPFLDFGDGVKQSLAIDPTAKTLTLIYVDSDDVSRTLSSNFSFTLEGLMLEEPLVYKGSSFNTLLWDADAKVYYINNKGSRINVVNSTTPVIPLRMLFGPAKDYSQIEYNPVAVTNNLSSDFNTKYAAAKTGLNGLAGRTLNYVRVIFTVDNTMLLRFYYNNTAGSSFQANMTYEVTKGTDNTYSFRYIASDNNGTVVGSGLVSLKDYFSNNTFKLDWVANPGGGSSFGGLYVVNDNSSFFYGTLIK